MKIISTLLSHQSMDASGAWHEIQSFSSPSPSATWELSVLDQRDLQIPIFVKVRPECKFCRLRKLLEKFQEKTFDSQRNLFNVR